MDGHGSPINMSEEELRIRLSNMSINYGVGDNMMFDAGMASPRIGRPDLEEDMSRPASRPGHTGAAGGLTRSTGFESLIAAFGDEVKPGRLAL